VAAGAILLVGVADDLRGVPLPVLLPCRARGARLVAHGGGAASRCRG
jgi:hypothetical protein